MNYIAPILTLITFLVCLAWAIALLTFGLYGPAACLFAAALLIGVIVWYDYRRFFGNRQ